MAEEELVDFGFSAVTADEYERDNTDGENTGSGGSASPEALASMDSKIEQIMAHLASQSDKKDEGWSTSDAKEDLESIPIVIVSGEISQSASDNLKEELENFPEVIPGIKNFRIHSNKE